MKDENKFEEKKRLEQEKKEHSAKREASKKQIEGVRGIVRVCETNVDGTKKIRQALLKVKGVGYAVANAAPKMSGFGNVRIGSLTDEQIEKIEDVIKNPVNYGFPAHMVNRARETFTGESHHLVESELTLAVKTDIDFMKKIRCYKGVRHEIGQPVRGQRTRSSFRTGVQVGVTRKGAAAPAKAAESAPAGGKGAAPAAGAKPAAGAAAGKTPAPAAGGAKPAAGKAAPAAAKPAAPAKKEEKK
ncbi:MAG: 30S ribosomal protein S13 [Nanoarchaeota archaeon]|nr:30S ribosomal protein S13 [Nanoarchaeota archaeon]